MAHSQVVRVYSTYQDPDHECPWQSLAPRGSNGSGVVTGPGEILTGAHVIANATFVQVQKPSDPTKVVARVTSVSHDADLALLRVDDPAFTRGMRAVQIGDLPHLRDEVQVVGYPIGGEEVSITEGVVSRIEVQRYEHSQRHLLAVTVDAAINSGNSGGPVFAGRKVVGIAIQSMPDAENIGDMVPATIIKRFLAAARRGEDRVEVPGFGFTTQPLENPALRRHLGMTGRDSGVLITAVQYGSSAWGTLQVGDVLLEVDGMRVANNGTVQYRDRFRCQFDVAVSDHSIGDTLRARILRDRKRIAVKFEARPMCWLVPRIEFEQLPTWFLFGGLVFQRLTAELLRVWGDNWWDKAPKELLHLYSSGVRRADRQEIIVLAHVLADAVNVGYEPFVNDVVVEVNGTGPANMAEFVRLLEAAQGDVSIRLSSGAIVLLPAVDAWAANARIAARYQLPGDRSRDLPAARRTARTRKRK
ncbi:MAG: trypsin-like peptidase domain-containing protein [Planctomycetes bacterium]|nr:trypsin-like peptidase domain-containing protein [Planctomycetota bacterium]